MLRKCIGTVMQHNTTPFTPEEKGDFMNIIKKYLEKLMKKACHRTIKDCDKMLIKKPFDI